MLDVLDLDPLRAPDEDRVRVRCVDDVRDLEPELLRLGDVLFGGLDLDREVVQERLLRVAGLALVELDKGPADLDARCSGRPGRRLIEAELPVSLRRLLGRARPERNVVEVVVDVGRRLHEPEPKPLVHVEVGLAVAGAIDGQAVAEIPGRLLEARDP